jgi:hypothetical protein
MFERKQDREKKKTKYIYICVLCVCLSLEFEFVILICCILLYFFGRFVVCIFDLLKNFHRITPRTGTAITINY